jgi:P4 family phage/plasmid primase-like protien
MIDPPGSPPNANDIARHGKMGIPADVLALVGRRVSDWEARHKCGIRFSLAKNCSGFWYIYRDPLDEHINGGRLRRDVHEWKDDGRPQDKYLSPWGNHRHLFYPPNPRELINDPETEWVYVESEKGALVVTEYGKRHGRKLLAVGIGGCDGWRDSKAKSAVAANGARIDVPGPCDDLKYSNGHRVFVMLDSNARIDVKPNVYWAKARLLVEMNRQERKSDVWVCDLPFLPNVNGPDDLVAEQGDQALTNVFAQAHRPAYKTRQQQDEAEAAQSEAGAVKRSQDELALQFTHQHPDLRYTGQHGRWNIFDGLRWPPDDTCRVFDLIRAVCRAEAAVCTSITLARQIASAATVAAVERLARADRRHAVTADQWDADPWLLNTPGGVVDLRTGMIRPARREDYQTKITAVAPGGDCPLWMKFLEKITNNDEKLVAYLQRACGYCLTGLTIEHAMLFFFGRGANGKGTFVDTFAGAFGDYARTASIETFLDSKSERHPTELAWLQGARFVTATETEQGRRWAEAKLKQLTGGDPVAARYMRCDFFEFVPQFKLIVQGNHKPALRSVDEAIRRRFHLVPFVVTIPPEERDQNLKEKLRAQWGGILSWAIEGALAWQRDGLNPPAAVRDATAEYFAQEDAIGRWIEDRCEAKTSAWELTSTLFADYRQWTEANGEFTGSEKAFSQNLQSRGFRAGRTNAARTFQGIALRGAR